MDRIASETRSDEQKGRPDYAAKRDDVVKLVDAAKRHDAGGIAHTQNARF